MQRNGNGNGGLFLALLAAGLALALGCTPGGALWGGGGTGGTTGSKLKAEVSNGAFLAQVEYAAQSGQQTMQIVVSGGTPGATVDISVNGMVIASVPLDDQGNGRLDLSSAPAGVGEQPLPEGFHPPDEGDEMNVGDLRDSFASVQVELKADMSSAGFRAQVNYEVDSAKVMFRVRGRGGEANAVLAVTAAGFAVGSITLDADGGANMRWSSRTGHDGEEPLPAGFPALAEGDAVTVGSLSGVLSTDNGKEGDDHEGDDDTGDDDDQGGSELRAEMSSGQQSAVVSAEESSDGVEVQVTVSGGAAGAVLDVSISGVSLGSITLDAAGAASVEFAANADEPDELPLPDGFALPVAGDSVAVGDMSGVFAADPQDGGNGSPDDSSNGGSDDAGGDDHSGS